MLHSRSHPKWLIEDDETVSSMLSLFLGCRPERRYRGDTNIVQLCWSHLSRPVTWSCWQCSLCTVMSRQCLVSGKVRNLYPIQGQPQKHSAASDSCSVSVNPHRGKDCHLLFLFTSESQCYKAESRKKLRQKHMLSQPIIWTFQVSLACLQCLKTTMYIRVPHRRQGLQIYCVSPSWTKSVS